MNADTVYLFCNYGVLPAWLLLALAPRLRLTQVLVHQVWIPALLALFYIWAFATAPQAPEGAGFGSLKALVILFQSPMAVLAGWIHYLAFDLFIGAWQVRDAQRRGINHWLMLPCLFFTLMAGPIGLLLYFLLRFVMRQTVDLNEAEPVGDRSGGTL